MTDKEKRALSAISMSRKAGKLLWGFDTVAGAMRAGRVKLLLLAEDLSEKTKKEAAFLCDKNNVRLLGLPFTMQQIWEQMGKRSGILAVTDQGLADSIEKKVDACRVESCVIPQDEEGRM